jgi:ADP-glucose pyrophosphorylase
VLSEDYLVFAVHELDRPHTADDLVSAHGEVIAGLLRGEAVGLSRQEREEVLSHRISYLANDLVIPTWNAAFVWADVGTVESFYEANILLTQPSAPFTFYDPRRPIFTHERFLPPAHFRSSTIRESIVADGCFLDQCIVERSVIGIRTHIGRGTRISRSVLLGADFFAPLTDAQAFGIGRDAVLDRVIIDKNARIGDGVRMVNDAGVQDADGDGFFIRNGIIIVPKEGTIEAGTVI